MIMRWYSDILSMSYKMNRPNAPGPDQVQVISWTQISILHGFGNHLLGFLLTNTGSYWKAGNGTVTLNSL